LQGVIPCSRSLRRTAARAAVYAGVELNDFLRGEIDRFAPMKPHRCSLQEVLSMREPWRAARFIHREVPVRYAERIRSIESIPGWESSPDLVDVHGRHVKTFQDIRLVKTRADRSTFSVPELVDSFTEVVESAVGLLQDMVPHLARAVHTLHSERGDEFDGAFVDKWLDDFLLNYIGSQMLLSQYLACVRGRPTGIIDSDCDVPGVCRQAVAAVRDLCERADGRVPHVLVETASAGKGSLDTAHFSYIPEYLRFMVGEILSNSCRATREVCHRSEDLRERPITVLVCGDGREVVIRIADRAKGIPFEVGKRIWSYLYSEAPEAGSYKACSGDVDQLPITFAGHGAGLPLSRLYARYLGGSLDLVSWPGYGTDVFISLPRLSSEQVEVVPDVDDEE